MIFPQELQVARLRLVKERPYLASAAWALQPVPKPGLGTLAVDMYWRLYYDPDIIAQWTVEVVSGVLYHEICHLLRNHAERMKTFDPRLSNIAADAEINDDLIREGVIFPTQPVTPELIGQPVNLLAEEYYTALEKQGQMPPTDVSRSNERDSSKKESPNPNGRSSDSQTSSSEQENSLERKSDSEPDRYPDSQNKDQKLPQPGSGRCGSCATGQMAPWEDEPPSKGCSSGISQIEGELIRRDVANQIKEHIQGRGRVPGHLARWAEEKLRPKVDWRKQLASAIRHATADTAGATDYSYSRPSRRQGKVGNGDVILPSLRRPAPKVAIVADTSASISDQMLSQTLAEISGILKAVGQKEGIQVIAVDQAVQSCRQVFRSEQIQLAGGGGTDMGVGLEVATRLKPLPQVGIVITDGLTPWPEHPPKGMKVIVALSGEGTAPDWASVVKVKLL